MTLLLLLIFLLMLHIPRALRCRPLLRSSFTTALNAAIYNSVTLEKGKARLFQDGNPLIYGGAVKSVEGDPQAGDEVIVKDHNGNVFGRGFYNPFSQYRVRIMTKSGDSEFRYPIAELIKVRISQSVQLRKAMMLPSSVSNVYRLVNGEGDRLSGLIIDVLGSTVVVQSSALWVELNSDHIRESLKDFTESGNKKLIWRRSESRLNQDGFANYTKVALTKEDDTEINTAQTAEIVRENGVRYSVDPLSDQKTGFYCDQRENRQLIKGICEGKTVLDTYCYTGGFSINAVLGGATEVTAVDSSRTALSALAANMELNDISPELLSIRQGDAVEVKQ